MRLLAIDPGLDMGWAVFEGGVMVACGLGDPQGGGHDHLVIECPRIYPASRSRGDPNDLITLAVMVGMCIGRSNTPFTHVFPYEWKGQTPKKISNNRVLKSLTPSEFKVLEAAKVADGKRHNILDAIGIGQWWLQR